MDVLKLSARTRTGTGKSYTRKARVAGWIPAAYYGHNRETKAIEINEREFQRLVRAKKANHLIDLALPGEENDCVSVIKEIQRDCIKDDRFLHIDFQHVAMNEKISVDCMVELVGLPIGVKDDGGILEHPLRRIHIECLPANIPEKLTVDVSGLHIGESIHVKDVSFENVTIKSAPEEVLAVVLAPSKEEATPAAAVAAAAAEAAAPAASAGAEKKSEAKSGDAKGKKE